MPLQIIDCDQGSPEWKQVRCKKVTSSRFKDVLAQGQGKSRESYLWQKVEECITGKVVENSFFSKDMQLGKEREPQARAIYLLESDALSVHVPGFCQLNDYVGASTDGLVDDDGMLEVKCPSMRVQFATVMKAKVPTEHVVQIQGGLWIAGRQWCDFVSSCPLLKGRMSYFCVRVFRDEEKIKQIEAEVNMFVADLLGLLMVLGKQGRAMFT